MPILFLYNLSANTVLYTLIFLTLRLTRRNPHTTLYTFDTEDNDDLIEPTLTLHSKLWLVVTVAIYLIKTLITLVGNNNIGG